MREDGETAAFEVGVHNLHPELIEAPGQDAFRSSYGQNALSIPLRWLSCRVLWPANADAISVWLRGQDFFMISESRLIMKLKVSPYQIEQIFAENTKKVKLL